MVEPLISIVIPCYNAENYIEDTIASVLNQTYNYFELIIIDDCSTDNSFKLIENIKDWRITLYKNNQNKGVSYSRNYGVSLAKGEWIAFLDSDDKWRRDKLEKQVNLINNEKTNFVFTGTQYIDGNNNISNYILEVPEKVNYKKLLQQNVISCSSILIKKELLLNFKMKNDECHEDYYNWLSILKSGEVAMSINEPLLVYRISYNSKSSNKIKASKMTYLVYKYLDIPFYLRIYYFVCYSIKNIIKYTLIKKGFKKNDNKKYI